MKKIFALIACLLIFAVASCASADEVPGYRRIRIKGTHVNLRNVPDLEVSRVLGQADDGDEFVGASWPASGEWRLIIFSIARDGSLTFAPRFVHKDYSEELPLRDGDAARIAATEYGDRRGAPGTFGEVFGASWHDIVRKFGSEVPIWDPDSGRTIGMAWQIHFAEEPDGSLTGDWGWSLDYRSSGLVFSFQPSDDDPFGRVSTTVWLREGAPEVLGVELHRTTRAGVNAMFAPPHETSTFDDGRTLMSWRFPDPLGGDIPDSFWLWFNDSGVAVDGGFSFSSPETKIWPGLFRGASDVVDVSDGDELYMALRHVSSGTIRLAPGVYDITSPPNDVREEGNLAFYGDAYILSEASGLEIVGAGAGKTNVVLSMPELTVLSIRECEDLKISGITFGHVPVGNDDNCAGDVLDIYGCKRVTLEDVDIFGCGVVGLSMHGCRDVSVVGSIIRDCTMYLATVSSSSARFSKTRFRHRQSARSEALYMWNDRGSGVTFEDCDFAVPTNMFITQRDDEGANAAFTGSTFYGGPREEDLASLESADQTLRFDGSIFKGDDEPGIEEHFGGPDPNGGM